MNKIFYRHIIFFSVINLILTINNISFADITLPEPKIVKAFSSFGKLEKYEFKPSLNLYVSTANTSIGAGFDILNNVSDKIATDIGFDIRYHFYHADNNAVTKLKKEILSDNVNFKISPKMDFLFRIGTRFKLGKKIKLMPYGIVGFNWTRLHRESINNEQTVNISYKKDGIGGGNDERDNEQTVNISYKKDVVDVDSYFDYVIDCIDKNKENESFTIDETMFLSDNRYKFTSNGLLGENVKITSKAIDTTFSGGGGILIKSFYNNAPGYINLGTIEDYYNKAKNRIEKVRSDNQGKNFIFERGDAFDNNSYMIKYVKNEENGQWTKEIISKTTVYQSKECDGEKCYAVFLLTSPESTEEELTEEELKKQEPNKSFKDKIIGKYGAGVEMVYNDKITLKLEYLYSKINPHILSTKKFDIHEISFGLGFYIL